MDREIRLPEEAGEFARIKKGDYVYISGTIYRECLKGFVLGLIVDRAMVLGDF